MKTRPLGQNGKAYATPTTAACVAFYAITFQGCFHHLEEGEPRLLPFTHHVRRGQPPSSTHIYYVSSELLRKCSSLRMPLEC